MGWLTILLALLPLLKALLDWLSNRSRLTDKQIRKVNDILARFKEIEAVAVPLGCKRGGEPEEE